MSDSDLLHRAHQWIVSDDTGISSEAIWAHMLGVKAGRVFCSAPSDPSDLGRCLRLLKRIPEWSSRITEMAVVSTGWARLIPHWNRLASSMDREVGIDWSKGKRAPKTYALMKLALDGELP